MAEDPPDTSGGKPADEATNEVTQDEGPRVEAGGTTQGETEHQVSTPAAEWWRIDPAPPTLVEQGTPPGGTPPSGTPPYGTPPPGTPPYGTPPYGTPPPGTPPWSAPGWGGPPWGGPPQWYGWGPGWQGGPPQAAPGFPSPAASPRRPVPWVILGAVLAGVAMIALGLGIGYSVWGSSVAAVGTPRHVTIPFPRISPSTGIGRRGFLGVDISSSPSTSKATTPGAHVVAVVPSSPAAKAGIVKGDTITEFDTKTVASAAALEIDVVGMTPGTHVKVGWVTSTGKHDSATVTLAPRPLTAPVG
jgi:membrane-associated protease RseP (regulator of RpoE activity)